ncbi:hypothetical protein GDO86_010017 [Hymenochirus boettgeri]|uniref:Cation-transporting ATPase n=1 Tax=Hymenochirus boettgeri TaxID=247094 RepID=A0A8T2JMU6_9PIPI|nr:hypothetical protein GDO86_010017 [Hymenochirus boettgeri]
MTDKYALLNQGEGNEMELFGYKTVRWQQTLCMIGYFCSLGFLRSLFYRKPELDVWAQCVPCSLGEADIILIRNTGELGNYSKKKVIEIYPHVSGCKPAYQIITDKSSIIRKSLIEPEGMVRYIQIQKIRYVWNVADGKFQNIGTLENELSCSDIHSKFGPGFTCEEQEIRRQVCGLNTINVEIKPISTLFFKEIFNLFYAFQVYTLCLWIFTKYLEYGFAILAMTIISIIATLYVLRKQSVKLHNMAKSYNSIVATVLRKNGEIEDVESQSLVPGDVLVLLGNQLFLPCDAILINGECTVNEGMLTGESIPVTKIPLPHTDSNVPWKIQSGEDYNKHILFCGTEVIQTKAIGQCLVKAVVLQTGFNTLKGHLVSTILYNKHVNVKLHREANKFFILLLFIALAGVAYVVVIFKINGGSVYHMVIRSLIMLTIAVNPALPASLTFILLCVLARLKKQGIFCSSPQKINIAGQLNLVCFDKEMHHFNSENNLPWGPVLGAMASCHSIALLNGKMHGDPLDIKMFKETGWEVKHQTDKTTEDGESISCTIVNPGPKAGKVSVEGITILRQFAFMSALQRMSVITQVTGETHLTTFLKGAPEVVMELCKPETLPHNILQKLDAYTKQGFRVIALAYRLLPEENIRNIHQLKRNEVEADLRFLGFLILENRLKPETNAVLQELYAAKIRNVMVTGDNLQTAINIGIKCGMISNISKVIIIEANEPENDNPASIIWKTLSYNQEPGLQSNFSHFDIQGGRNNPSDSFHFAMSGKSFQIIMQHFYNLVPKILLNGTVFARMTPKLKESVVEEFKKLDYFVGMCGDGANDCTALKMAHVGISLSKLEASVASPFTYKNKTIECVPLLIKQGRNSLVTSISMFKFMGVLPLISLTYLVFMFWKKIFLSRAQLFMQSLAIFIPFCLTSGLNGPAQKLAPQRPSAKLLSLPVLLSIGLHFLFTVALHTTVLILLHKQPWYNETDVFSACPMLNHSTLYLKRKPTLFENFITTTEWLVAGINLIVIEFVYSKGRPFRQPLYTNYLFSLVIALQVASYLFFLFGDFESVYTTFEMVCTPYYWRIYILAILLIYFLVSYAVEDGFIENRRLWKVLKRLFNYQSKSQYKILQRKLKMDPDWPPQNRTDYARNSQALP